MKYASWPHTHDTKTCQLCELVLWCTQLFRMHRRTQKMVIPRQGGMAPIQKHISGKCRLEHNPTEACDSPRNEPSRLTQLVLPASSARSRQHIQYGPGGRHSESKHTHTRHPHTTYAAMSMLTTRNINLASIIKHSFTMTNMKMNSLI